MVGVGCCVGAGWWVVWWWCFVVVLVGGGGSFNQAFLSVSSNISVVFIQYFRAHTQTQKLSPFCLKFVEGIPQASNLLIRIPQAASTMASWLQNATESEQKMKAMIAAFEAKMKKGWNIPSADNMSLEEATKTFGRLNALGLEPADPEWKGKSGMCKFPYKGKVPARAEEQTPSAKRNARKKNQAKKNKNVDYVEE